MEGLYIRISFILSQNLCNRNLQVPFEDHFSWILEMMEN